MLTNKASMGKLPKPEAFSANVHSPLLKLVEIATGVKVNIATPEQQSVSNRVVPSYSALKTP